jgi:hypothetical protein
MKAYFSGYLKKRKKSPEKHRIVNFDSFFPMPNIKEKDNNGMFLFCFFFLVYKQTLLVDITR